MCVQYIGGISWCMWRDTMSTSGGYHEYIGDVQYIGVFNRNWKVFINLLPPHASWYPPDVLNISRCTEYLPMYSWYPPMYSWYPRPDVLMISPPRCTHGIPRRTEHTLYRVVFLVLQNLILKTINFEGNRLFCRKEIGLPKIVDFGENYFRMRLVSWQLKILLQLWGDFPSEGKSLLSLRSLPVLGAKGFGGLANLPFLEDGMKKYTFDVHWKENASSAEIRRPQPKNIPLVRKDINDKNTKNDS